MTQPEELAVIQGLRDKLDKVCVEREELKVECEQLKATIGELQNKVDKYSNANQYCQGVIDGLSFSVKCNGVSGNDVDMLEPWFK